MRHLSARQKLSLSCCSLLLFAVVMLSSSDAQSRSGGSTPSAIRTSDLKKIDKEASEIENEFLKNAYNIANQYEKAGDLERAIEYYEAMLKINPELDGAEDKIKELEDDILSSNDFQDKLEVNLSWGDPVAFVRAGKPFKIQVAGEYSMKLSTKLGPEGYPEGNIERDLVKNIAPGKLMGLIVPRQGARRNNNNDDEDDKLVPIDIGSGKEITPRNTGFLYLKVNSPPDASVRGTLEYQLSGYVLAPDGRNIGKK